MAWWRRGKSKTDSAEADCDESCSHQGHCTLKNIMTREGMKKWRVRYCDKADGYKNCARYQVSKDGSRVPFTLLPDGNKIGE